MWYVVQVRTGTEENVRIQCRKKLSAEAMSRCFIPYYEERRRIRGEWTTQQRILFPGYLFMITDDQPRLYEELKGVESLTKMLGTGNEIIPLEESDVEFLLRFGGKEQVVEMSEGIIEQSVVKILTGPLKGMEGSIRKIDRHKRKAYLELPMFGRMQQVEVGLEILSKTV